MKRVYYFLATILMYCGILSCKKNDIVAKPTASLNVINAVVGGGNVKLNTNYRDSAKKYNAKSFGLNAMDGTIRLYSTSDSLKPYYLQHHDLNDGEIYSMFLFGASPSPEYLFIKEDIPAPYSDSTFGVRVVNLASGSGPLNVTRESDPTTNVFTSVEYKQMADIVTLPLPFIGSTAAYVELRKTVNFQIRNADGLLLASYQLPVNVNNTYPGISINLQRFKNITLVVKGVAGVTAGPDAFGVFPAPLTY